MFQELFFFLSNIIRYFWSTINPLHPNISMHILHTVLYTSSCAGRENLFDNQEVLQLITISFILITLMFDLGVILKGEIRCKLLSGIKGLKKEGYYKNFYSSKYLSMRVVIFDIFTCNRMIKLKMA